MIGIKDQCFGCEIEMTGLSRARAAQAIAELFGTSYQHYGGYDAYHILPAPVSEPEEPQPTPEPTPVPTPTPAPVVRRIPQTGDDSPLALLPVLAGLSAAMLAVLLYWRHRHKTKDLPPENAPQYEVKDHESRNM